MAVKANHRIHRMSVNIVALVIVLVLSLILWIRVGWSSAQIVLQGMGIVVIAVLAAELITKRWIWKTWLGRLLGFPTDYSGKWEGKVFRNTHNNSVPQENRVEVIIAQSITHIDWYQVGYSDTGEKIAESHFILGEVIDEHRTWDAIVGIYEVQRTNGSKDSGMSFVRINESENEISGVYCGLNGHVGSITINRA